MLALYVKIPTM